MLKYRRLEVVEEQLVEHYRNVNLTAEGLERTAEALMEELTKERSSIERLRTRQEHRLKSLEAEQLKLLQAHYADAIPLELLKAEQQRIADEMVTLQTALEVVTASDERIRSSVEDAVAFARSCHSSYLRGSDRVRRLMNQAFFEKVWVREDGVVAWEYAEPFALLMRKHGAPEPHLVVEHLPDQRTRANDAFEPESDSTYYRRSPGQWTRAYLCQSSKENYLAEGVGFEPTVDIRPQRFSRPSDSAALASLRVPS